MIMWKENIYNWNENEIRKKSESKQRSEIDSERMTITSVIVLQV